MTIYCGFPETCCIKPDSDQTDPHRFCSHTGIGFPLFMNIASPTPLGSQQQSGATTLRSTTAYGGQHSNQRKNSDSKSIPDNVSRYVACFARLECVILQAIYVFLESRATSQLEHILEKRVPRRRWEPRCLNSRGPSRAVSPQSGSSCCHRTLRTIVGRRQTFEPWRLRPPRTSLGWQLVDHLGVVGERVRGE